jgi:hypothetical protein
MPGILDARTGYTTQPNGLSGWFASIVPSKFEGGWILIWSEN